MTDMTALYAKYDVPGPRYTSYPTVPYWDGKIETARWLQDIKESTKVPSFTWSLYIHLPYCETRCWFCACNATGTRNHEVEGTYVDGVLREFELYLKQVPELRNFPLRQLHLGGGTPTFFSASSLERLLSGIQKEIQIDFKKFDASIEVNPNFTVLDHLKALAAHGFKRISFGVQDFDPKVQAAIHRVQSPERTDELKVAAIKAGFEAVNFDLIYGLPHQTRETIRETAQTTIRLKPDRIALYSFALVPWVQPAHRALADRAPKGQSKRELYEECRSAFLSAGYREIGMDHFALPGDALSIAQEKGTLHRNFMGYTEYGTTTLIGLGASSISETPGSYHQNEKEPPQYLATVAEGRLPTTRGHVMTDEDRKRKKQILSLMTQLSVELEDDNQAQGIAALLAPMVEDGLLIIEGRTLKLTEAGKPFLRNACMAFDERMKKKEPHVKVFSQTV